MSTILFTRSFCPYALAAEALVHFLDLNVEIVSVSEDPALFNQLFPVGNRFTPAIYESSTGFKVNQSIAVNNYLLDLAPEKKGLGGKGPKDRYLIEQWSAHTSGDFVAALKPIPFSMWGYRPSLSKSERAEILNAAEKPASVLERHLSENRYLLGDQLTLADLQGAGVSTMAYMVGSEWRKSHPHFTRWFEEVIRSEPFGGRFQDLSYLG